MSTTVSAGTSSDRLVSLDVFRGITIAGMLLVNNAGDWNNVYAPLRHAEWNGCTVTDLIFPFFLFITGVSMAFSFGKRKEKGADVRGLILHSFRRGVILVALGLVLNAMIYFALNADYLRYPGVLQRIGTCYFLAALLFLMHKPRGLVVWFAGLLVGYWILMSFIPVPGYGSPDLTREGNLASWTDSRVFGPHNYQWNADTRVGHDPEGLLSTLPSLATTLAGCLTGIWLRRWRGESSRVISGLILSGVLMLGAGMLWSVWFPLNKNLWTSSYVLVSGGWALIGLSVCYLLVDVWKKRWWAKPFQVYGMNAIAAYVGASATAYLTIWIRVAGPEGDPIRLKTWIYSNLYESWIPSLASPHLSSAAYGFTYVVVWCLIMWVLYWRKVFIRI